MTRMQTHRIVAQLALGVEPSFVLQAELARFEKEVRENLCEHLQCKPLQNESQITRIGELNTRLRALPRATRTT